MRRFRQLLVAAVGAVSLVGAAGVSAAAGEGNTLVEFDSMTPVTGSAVGAVNDRGIKGGGLPWAITSGSGELDHQGNLEVQVTGLIIPVLTPPHNPIGAFSAAVSCLTPGGTVTNVTTGSFATGPSGDVTITATVALPHPCKDAEVFVGFTNPSTGAFAWFAESNAEGDD